MLYVLNNGLCSYDGIDVDAIKYAVLENFFRCFCDVIL